MTKKVVSKIGFVIYYPFQFYVYKNVYQALAPNAEFIIDLGVFFPKRQINGVLEDIVNVLKAHGAHYRILNYEYYFSNLHLQQFLVSYDALVSVWTRGCVNTTAASEKTLIHMTYGAGKELTTFNLSKGKFDLVLAYGNFDNAFYSQITKSVVVGNPKFDDWFDDRIDSIAVTQIREKIDSSKKTILYLPTHSDLSSIDQLHQQLGRLKQDYNVLVKMHYYTPREEAERVHKLQSQNLVLYQDDTDLLPLLKVADVVLSDNSSAIFDAILADKPLLVADFWGKEFLDVTHREVRRYRRGTQAALTYSGSVEQVIKKKKWVHTIRQPEDLSFKLSESLEDSAFYKQKRKELREKLFAFNDGKSAKRAAVAIQTHLRSSLSERPFLYHALEAYKRSVGRLSYERERDLNKEIAQLKSALHAELQSQNIVFTTVYIHNKSIELESVHQALRSLLEQDFPAIHREIILCNISKEEFENITQSIQVSVRPAIQEISSCASLSGSLEKAFAIAKGTFVSFASSECFLPSDWFTKLYAAYRRNPDTAGVGGYVSTLDGLPRSQLQEYYDREISMRLNITAERQYRRYFYEVTNRLFYQNPAGALSGMSYRKERLPSTLPAYDDVILLGLYLKMVVISRWPITFLPQSVIRTHDLEWKDFRQAERSLGFFYRLSKNQIFSPSPYERMHFVSLLWHAIKIVRKSQNIKLAFTLVIGVIEQSIGRIHAIWYMARLNTKGFNFQSKFL